MMEWKGRVRSEGSRHPFVSSKGPSQAKIVVITDEECEKLFSANQRHARTLWSWTAVTSVDAKLLSGQREVKQDAIEKRIFMCSGPQR